MTTLEVVTRGEQGTASQVLARQARRGLTITKPFSKWPSFTAKFAQFKAWRIFLKTAQKLLNQITAVTGLITIEYLLILSQTEITDVS